MRRYDHLREIAILPCLPAGLSVEDEYLTRIAPSFDLQFAEPNAALARTLSFLNISKRHFFELVQDRRGIDLRSSKPQGQGTGPWRHRGEFAATWRSLKVAHNPHQPQLLTDDEIVTIFENASYGGQLAIAGYVDADFCLPLAPTALRLSGRFQIGIIDYIWGSGYSVSWDGDLTVDLSHGQAGNAPGCAYDEGCNFVVSYFRFSKVASAALPPGRRWEAVRAVPLASAA